MACIKNLHKLSRSLPVLGLNMTSIAKTVKVAMFEEPEVSATTAVVCDIYIIW